MGEANQTILEKNGTPSKTSTRSIEIGDVHGTERKVRELLASADIQINGDRPWDMQVHDDRLYGRVMRHGSLGLGEAYMDGWWDARAPDQFFFRLLRAEIDREAVNRMSLVWDYLKFLLLNPQNNRRAYQVGRRHYDKGNDLFEAMLDRRMVYTCGYWFGVDTLDKAQEKKLDTVCRNLGLHEGPGQRVLDIGCGWGSFAQYAAEQYGAQVVGITVSREQMELARERCRGLPVEIRLQDYRQLDEPFDHIVSLGMFEHVGVKNYRTYMQVVARCLSDHGVFVLHTIGGNLSVTQTDPWVEKYIFPNSMIPSIQQIGRAVEGLFVVEQWDNYGPHYDRTLMAWHRNFNDAWDELRNRYSGRFYRMWNYYLLSSAGSFRARKNQQWQIILTKNGLLNR